MRELNHPSPGAAAACGAEAASAEAAFVLDARDARFLTEVGMLAAGRGDVTQADRVFTFLRRQRPNRAFPLLGLAVARLNAGRALEAARLLREVQLPDPDEQAVVQSWFGLALQLAGRCAESRQVLLKATQNPGEGGALARHMLGLAADATENNKGD